MTYKELFERYQNLLKETERLRNENRWLKTQLALNGQTLSPNADIATNSGRYATNGALNGNGGGSDVKGKLDALSKIKLFISMFKGREDLYAKRWENPYKGTSGYAPVCLNQWRAGVCGKPKIACARCGYRSYAALDEDVIEDHLRGNIVVGIYPMLADGTCRFLAMDFDKTDWPKDIAVLRQICTRFGIPVAVERSRSGNGAHLWFFFEHRLPAALARKFGTALLTHAMDHRHALSFKSYDRLFPSQDTLPRGGFGNLIALPLQKSARQKGNSEFIDADFNAYDDQWAFLSTIKKLSEKDLLSLITMLCRGTELGALNLDGESEKPWENHKEKIELQKTDFPPQIEVVKANMLFIPKMGISAKGLNHLKRLAAFKNPMFYKQQAMRLSTYGHPRVIACADETERYLCLPRGCGAELTRQLQKIGVAMGMMDRTFGGNPIDVEFTGQLREEQTLALTRLLEHDIGILCGTTAFGKTIVAIKLIAVRSVNTLILVDKVSLLHQWKEKLSQFLRVNEALPEPYADGEVGPEKRRMRKKKTDPIGQLGGGRQSLNGIVDIALIQSLSRQVEVKACVKNYGMIIADECHHASAFTYERILKSAPAKYIYGLTATPARKDGHHPILFMQCGPVRYRDDPKKQAQKRPFEHYIIPRFTSLKVPMDRDEAGISIQELYTEIQESEYRNQQIVDDVLRNYHQGRNCLVLSLRIAHVELLVETLRRKGADVVMLVGGMGKKRTQEAFRHLARISTDNNFILASTGHYIGEGFDDPRLDTLFLAMPISWKGTLQQYAGRLHRLFAAKREVRIYDYVDINVKMLEKMYRKRLNGYASMGYHAKGDEGVDAPLDIIFNQDNFLPVFSQDLVAAKREILIVSPFVRLRRTRRMLQHLQIPISKAIRIVVVTRPKEDFAPMERSTIQRPLDLLSANGITVLFKSNIHQKFALLDQKVVWYGSINLLSYGSARESIMRLQSAHIANELMHSIDGD